MIYDFSILIWFVNILIKQDLHCSFQGWKRLFILRNRDISYSLFIPWIYRRNLFVFDGVIFSWLCIKSMTTMNWIDRLLNRRLFFFIYGTKSSQTCFPVFYIEFVWTLWSTLFLTENLPSHCFLSLPLNFLVINIFLLTVIIFQLYFTSSPSNCVLVFYS